MGASFDIGYVFSFLPKLLDTLGVTLLIVAGSLLTGIVAGFLVALPRMYKIPVLRALSGVYLSFFRGTPILIQLFLFYYGLPELLKPLGFDLSRAPVMLFVILAYGLHTGAYAAEMIRASVEAVDRGQVEAAYAAGMTPYQALSRIVLPQALGIAVPVFSNLVIALLKDTSLAFTLGVMEMTGKAQTLGTLTQHFVETYIALALIYLVISFTLEKVLLAAERRLNRHEAREERVVRRFALGKRGSYRAALADIETGKGGGI
ncbi:amino acid ABC transporter permease [Saccharibacillus sp. CPCC 101409]|uniref:amino acid ABC transporter permease n=1 Tax=Saccharibacillus sp. CPCC 101409 TaxID=3058041 RepID=UPI0026721BAA|nr:amino acid ABC transporter permease [Saccharibacillus sp. CPCC 101409]MDO3409122.1 amino acid ABC transporter permease [Saccharibacillus sp. CPCC 101409]